MAYQTSRMAALGLLGLGALGLWCMGGVDASEASLCMRLLVLGVVEGLTEFIPVSSGAHLLIAHRLMGFDAHQALYLPYLYVMMQLGAICAGFLILSSHLKTLVRGLTQGEHEGKHLLACLILAFIPTGAAGLLLASFIKPIQAVAVLPLTLAAGGMIMLAVEFLYKKRNNLNPQPLRQLSFWQALVIGGCQALSLVPGMSRSMTSIAGGYCVGLGRKDAVVFSFLLGIVTIGAASCYELIAYLLSDAPTIPLSAWAVALLASFLTALTVASGWLQLLIRYGLVPFALYRFLVAAWIYTLCG